MFTLSSLSIPFLLHPSVSFLPPSLTFSSICPSHIPLHPTFSFSPHPYHTHPSPLSFSLSISSFYSLSLSLSPWISPSLYPSLSPFLSLTPCLHRSLDPPLFLSPRSPSLSQIPRLIPVSIVLFHFHSISRTVPVFLPDSPALRSLFSFHGGSLFLRLIYDQKTKLQAAFYPKPARKVS